MIGRPLGLDLSCTSTGWAVYGKEFGRIRTDLAEHIGLSDIDKRRHTAAAVEVLTAGTAWAYLSLGVSLVVIEAPFAMPGRPKVNRKIDMLHGVILDRLPYGLPVAYVPPKVLKVHLAGRGDADKQQMIAAAQAAGYSGKQNDEADAYGLALIGHHLLGGIDHLTPQRAACLAQVAWEVPMVAVPS